MPQHLWQRVKGFVATLNALAFPQLISVASQPWSSQEVGRKADLDSLLAHLSVLARQGAVVTNAVPVAGAMA